MIALQTVIASVKRSYPVNKHWNHWGNDVYDVIMIPKFSPFDNQSVENAGVAFVKGANERNEFFEKINKRQTTTDEQSKGLTISGTN